MSTVAPSVDGASTEPIPSGTIRWKVDKDSISNDDIFSPAIEVGGMPWKIIVRKSDDHLTLSLLLAEGHYKMQSVTAMVEYRLINYHDDDKIIKKKGSEVTFVDQGKQMGYTKFVEWEEAMDERKGFIRNNKLIVLIDFSLVSIIGFRKLRRMDFTDPNEPSHDVVLVVDKDKLYASKSYLSILSPVFHAMFYGNFAEKNKKEIELKDVDSKEFIELLHVLYPPHEKITFENCESLLKLGDRFEIEIVTNQIEQFLITSSKFTVAAKLVLAERYRLFKLRIRCLDGLKTIKDVAKLKKTAESKNFSTALNLALLDKMVELCD